MHFGRLAELDLIKKNPSVKQTELAEQTGTNREVRHCSVDFVGAKTTRKPTSETAPEKKPNELPNPDAFSEESEEAIEGP